MMVYDNTYLQEIRQRAIDVYEAYDDRYIGDNSVSREESDKETCIKIKAINCDQMRAYSYFLYTFTPLKVITLIDGVLQSQEKIERLEKEADWLALQNTRYSTIEVISISNSIAS